MQSGTKSSTVTTAFSNVKICCKWTISLQHGNILTFIRELHRPQVWNGFDISSLLMLGWNASIPATILDGKYSHCICVYSTPYSIYCHFVRVWTCFYLSTMIYPLPAWFTTIHWELVHIPPSITCTMYPFHQLGSFRFITDKIDHRTHTKRGVYGELTQSPSMFTTWTVDVLFHIPSATYWK